MIKMSYFTNFSRCNFFSLLSLLLTTILFTINAHAACTPGTGNSITLPSFNQNFDSLAINSPIGGLVMSTPANNKQFTCPGVGIGKMMIFGIYTSGSYVSTINGRRIFSTNIPGIGYALGLTGYVSSGSGNIACPSITTPAWIGETDSSYPNQPYEPNNFFSCGSNVLMSYYVTFYLQFYKIANQVGSGTLDLSNQIYSVAYLSTGGTDTTRPLITTPSNIVNNSCTNSISPNPVNLPSITANQLPNLNSTTGSTTFNININCSYSTNLYITFTDKNSPTQTGNILTPDSGSTSKGVGMQLSYNSNTVNYGPDSASSGNTNQFFLRTFSGQQSFPLSVSYIRTGAITAGTLSTTATFTFSYQ